MTKKILALCDTDNRFMQRLRDLLEERESFPFSVSVYSDYDNLKKDLTKGIINAALISDRLINTDSDKDEDLFEKNNSLLMILDSGAVNRGKAPLIRKYRSGEYIRREILGCCSDYKLYEEKDGISAGPSPQAAGFRETKVICAYTPVGRCLQTTFSVLMGQLLSKRHPVLYINGEPFSTLCNRTEFSGQNDITDLVYYMRNNPEKMLLKLESMIVSLSGLDCIPPPKNLNDLQSVEGKDWLTLIKTIRESGLYEYVILDLSSAVYGLTDMLRYGDYVYTVTRPDSNAEAKIKIYEESLNETDYGDILKKSKKLSFTFYRNLPSDLSALPGSEMRGAVSKIIQEDFGIEL